MNNIKISVALATFNEENNIVDCIESAKKLSNDIVIVDGYSLDRTFDLAKKHGAQVFQRENKKMFNVNKNFAIKNCKGEWVFLLDADERITEKLAKEIKEKINENPPENGFYINRKNWFLGGFLTKGGAYPDSVIRLFKKNKGFLPENDVHEQVKIQGQVGNLHQDIIHLADPSFSRYLLRANRYTERTAENLKESKPSKGFMGVFYYMVIKPLITFLKIYFRHSGYKDGFRGFVWALFSAAHHFYAYSKYLTNK